MAEQHSTVVTIVKFRFVVEHTLVAGLKRLVDHKMVADPVRLAVHTFAEPVADDLGPGMVAVDPFLASSFEEQVGRCKWSQL
jgi:hypothetical protein